MTDNSTQDGKVPREWSLTRLAFAAWAIGLLASLANLLNFHAYPAWRLEVGLTAAAVLLVAACATALHRLAQPRISCIFTGLFVAILVDLGTDISNNTFYAIIGVIAVLAWFRERMVLKLTIAAYASVLLFQTAGLLTGYDKPASPPNEARHLQTAKPASGQLRPIIHLMLDSYIGFEGMSLADANFGNLRQEQEQFYLSRGFQIYPQAYSRHGKTVNSLPEFLTYGTGKHATQPRNVQFTTAPQLNYFVDLDRKGYRTSVQTPSFVDLCVNQPLTWCRNYNRSDLSSMADSGLSAIDRARVIGLTLLELSDFTAIPAAVIDAQIAKSSGTKDRHLFNRTKLYSLTGFRELDRFVNDLSGLQYGEARFIHLLLPHDPYTMDAHCKLLPEARWLDEHGPAAFAARDAAYARQTRCMTQGGLTRLMQALNKTPAGRDAIVLIQGDHGSRTIDGVPLADGKPHSLRELAVTHSAFFAMRVPGEAAQAHAGRFALDELFASFAARDFAAAPLPVEHPAEVYLMDDSWIPRQRISLPGFTRPLTGH